MRRWTVTLLAAGLAVPALMLGPAGDAEALSCVHWPDDVSDGIASGRLPMPGVPGGTVPFTEHYDYAVIGKVTSVGGAGVLRRREVAQVEVGAALYRPVAGSLTLEMSDDDGMSGYPFEVGRTYLIPVTDPGPDGMRNYVMLCHPVVELAGPEVATLTGTARAAGVLKTVPGVRAPAGATAGSFADHPGAWTAAGAVVLAGLAATGLLARRRRRSGPTP